jgi:ferredoxin-NADP reductase
VAGAALPGRLSWLAATVVGDRIETRRARTLRLDVPGWRGHRAGQHVDVRLTAADGYQAQRSYSIASAPGDEHLELTVERLDDGEVSPYLVDQIRPGDQFELRGPIGSHFAWTPEDGGPLLMLAGGSGVVPFRAMLRARAAAGSDVPATLLVSARSPEALLFRGELEVLGTPPRAEVVQTYTRGWPPEWRGRTGRVSAEMLAAVGAPPSARPRAFVCGPTGFVEAATKALVALGHAPGRIAAERFGPTGA